MSSSLPTLCFDEIFKHLGGDLSSLRACALVNRHWWRHAVVELWRDPFVVFKSRYRRAKLFNSLLLFFDETNSKPTHGPCLAYLKKFNLAELVKTGKSKDRIDLKLIKDISHVIVSYGNNLQELDNDLLVPFFQNRFYISQRNFDVSLWNLFEFPNANTSFTYLQRLFVDNLNAYPILKAAISVAPNINEISIRMYCRNYWGRCHASNYTDDLFPISSLDLLGSFTKLERFNIVEGPRTRWRSFEADTFLCQVGSYFPATINHFGFDVDCKFSVGALTALLDLAPNLISLSFTRCTKFSKEHLKAICQHKEVHLNTLSLPSHGNVDRLTLQQAKKQIAKVCFETPGSFHDIIKDYDSDDSYIKRNKLDYYNQAYDSSDYEYDSSTSYAERCGIEDGDGNEFDDFDDYEENDYDGDCFDMDSDDGFYDIDDHDIYEEEFSYYDFRSYEPRYY
ncbi:hypothetical protein Glove_74g105 [Diversispora epigaea]|uniref:F-box domain-containing protein n=1 Tax=Diversispora epigaea TaxID=1348612 RepID=A0A397JDB7_9GLOM|nr:hypothetical protein Glove_74g105 [Diversispora epigaea]